MRALKAIPVYGENLKAICPLKIYRNTAGPRAVWLVSINEGVKGNSLVLNVAKPLRFQICQISTSVPFLFPDYFVLAYIG